MQTIVKFSLFFTFLLTYGICQTNARRFVHTPEELALTTEISETINYGQCINNDIVFIVHSAAQSSGRYYEKRQAARQTWVADAIAKNISVIFAIALPSSEQIQTELQAESNRYKDMVQFTGFIDDYWNLTLKAVAVAHWVTQYCTNVQFVTKLDDDIFVNVDRLVETRYQIKNGITGHIYGYQTKPDRDPESRYYMPEWAYPHEWYPVFVSGLFYITTKDIFFPMYPEASNWTSEVLDFDDLYMTGIVGERINLERHRSSEVVYRENTNPDCGISDVRVLNQMIAYHGCSEAEYSINMYNAWKQTKEADSRNGSFKLSSAGLSTLALLLGSTLVYLGI
jgi:beta-1,3-galactosyltransferase 1